MILGRLTYLLNGLPECTPEAWIDLVTKATNSVPALWQIIALLSAGNHGGERTAREEEAGWGRQWPDFRHRMTSSPAGAPVGMEEGNELWPGRTVNLTSLMEHFDYNLSAVRTYLRETNASEVEFLSNTNRWDVACYSRMRTKYTQETFSIVTFSD